MFKKLSTITLLFGLLVSVGSAVASPHAAAEPLRPPPDDWLANVNWYRAQSGLAPVSENVSWSQAAYNHSCYMTLNTITHDEIPGRPGYTSSGDTSGNNSNVAVSSSISDTAQDMIDLWMTGPFHAIGLLRPNLTTSGFDLCRNSTATTWKTAGTLNVLQGLAPKTPLTAPILFPGAGSVSPLNQFIVETPDPLAMCGISSAGLPIVALLPESAGSGVPTAVVRDHKNAIVPSCVLSKGNTSGVANSILAAENAVVVVPTLMLPEGNVSVSITTPSRTVSWAFEVDATPFPPLPVTPPAVPQAVPLQTGLLTTVISPTRIVDTRLGQGVPATMQANTTAYVEMPADVLPAGASTAQMTITALSPASSGFLTVYPCTSPSSPRPTTSWLNFTQGTNVANSGVTPLGPTGGFCVYASATTGVLVDVTQALSVGGTGKFTPQTPSRLMDTRLGQGGIRLEAGETRRLVIPGATAATQSAALNIGAISPQTNGFITAWSCELPRPTVSAVQARAGETRAGQQLVPVSADGDVCLYSSTAVDLIVDLSGTTSTTPTGRTFTSTQPYRLLDTRITGGFQVNPITNGLALVPNTTYSLPAAGVYGMPAAAKAVTVNVTAVGGSTGFVQVFDCSTQQTASALNMNSTAAVANNVHVPLSSTGRLCIRSSVPVHVIVDVYGWWS